MTIKPSQAAPDGRLHGVQDLVLDNRFARLGDAYLSVVAPTPLSNPRVLHANADVAALLDLDPAELHTETFTQVFSGNLPLNGGEPRAMLYAGHQFGQWVPQLGDGRAILLGQVRNRRGESWDLQLKGAGQTPYSRFADGRAVLRSSVREYLAGEALHHLGIPTTRALCLIAADDPVRRETFETAAVICRVAPSHVRFGNFEVFYSRGQHELLAPLADHVIDSHFQELAGDPLRYRRWLEAVIDRTARLMADWQSVGFCHGVMNTDNMSVLGITLDFGPYGFIDGFDAHHICNHSDEGGRYAYDQQPRIGHWNCSRLLQACLPLLDDNPETAVEIAQAILDRYPERYSAEMTQRWRNKFGLLDTSDDDPDLMNRFLSLLHSAHADFTLSFRALAEVTQENEAPSSLSAQFLDQEKLQGWLGDYKARLRTEQSDDGERMARMNAVNPIHVLRNHLAQRAIEDAERGGSAQIEHLLGALRAPYTADPRHADCAAQPPPEAQHISVSCSS